VSMRTVATMQSSAQTSHPVGDPRRRPSDVNPHSLVSPAWFGVAGGLSRDRKGGRAAPRQAANAPNARAAGRGQEKVRVEARRLLPYQQPAN
jgi:hypothetical protein